MLSLISDTSITKLNVSWFVKLATLVNQSKQGVYKLEWIEFMITI